MKQRSIFDEDEIITTPKRMKGTSSGYVSIRRTPQVSYSCSFGGKVWKQAAYKAAYGSSRSCTVKMSFSRAASAVLNQNKLNYMGRQEATLEMKPTYELSRAGNTHYTYNETGGMIRLDDQEAANLIGSGSCFRIILSPQDPGADLNLLAAKFMTESFFSRKGIGADTFRWVADNHYNTDHPHVHILVSRVNPKNGELYHFPKSYAKKNARSDAARILTDIMGPRSEREVKQVLNSDIERDGFSLIDQDIWAGSRKDSGGKFIPNTKLDDSAAKRLVRRRLNYLASQKEKYGPIVEKTPEGYKLSMEYKTKLQEDFLRKLFHRPDAIVDPPGSPSFEGKVIDVMDDNEREGVLYLAVEDKDGKVHLLEDRINEDLMEDLMKTEVRVKDIGNGRGIERKRT
jgi:hypothetical protein